MAKKMKSTTKKLKTVTLNWLIADLKIAVKDHREEAQGHRMAAIPDMTSNGDFVSAANELSQAAARMAIAAFLEEYSDSLICRSTDPEWAEEFGQ